MLSLLVLLAAFGGWRFTRSVRRALAGVPPRNADLGFFARELP